MEERQSTSITKKGEGQRPFTKKQESLDTSKAVTAKEKARVRLKF